MKIVRNNKGQFIGRGKITIICKKCFAIFQSYYAFQRKFCSKKCFYRFQIGRYKKEKSVLWKGDKAGYGAIHTWLKTNFGNPPKCENCGKIGKKINDLWNIHWAKLKNKEYERKRENFWGLCANCHIDYDGTSVGRLVKKGPDNPSWKGGKPKCLICNKEIESRARVCKKHKYYFYKSNPTLHSKRLERKMIRAEGFNLPPVGLSPRTSTS